jgi:outer membrane protein TolC
MRARLMIGWILAPLVAGAAGCAVAPAPLDEDHLMRMASVNFARITAGQEPLNDTLSLHEALARALKHNLDDQVELMQVALRADESRLVAANMLPGLVAGAGHSSRNNDFSTSDLDIPTGIVVPAHSVSQDRNFNSGDVTLSWHILDFALSYIRAQQGGDQQLIAIEARRKVTQRIIEDTRTAYWRAVSCDRMIKKLASLDQRVRRAISGTRTASAAGAESPITGLTYERELVQIRQTAERLQHELGLAKSQLAALINVPPGTAIALAGTVERPDDSILQMSAGEMVAEAIFNRPEIRDIAYQQRITEREATAALLDVLPGIRLTGTAAFDDNHFLLHNDWMGWGVSAAGNLIKLARLPAKRRAVEAQGEVLDQKALAVTMLVMTQVYISRIRYQHFSDQRPGISGGAKKACAAIARGKICRSYRRADAHSRRNEFAGRRGTIRHCHR